MIRQVQIFKNDDQARGGSEPFESFTEFANHPIASGTGDFAFERRALFGFNQRGELNQPCRRVLRPAGRQKICHRFHE